MAVEIKICGLTDLDEAVACVSAGATAIGLVFHPPSPRHLTIAEARDIVAVLPPHVARVGVFAESDAATILHIATEVGLTTLQLHGHAAMAALSDLRARPFHLVAVLRNMATLLSDAARLPTDVGLLIECGEGPLPGGNAAVWNWGTAAAVAALRPFAIAGGITAGSVVEAITLSGATAVDVSSGVESTPGKKEITKVRSLINNVRAMVESGSATATDIRTFQ